MPRAYSRPMNPPTEIQAAVHRFMLDYQRLHGKPTTVREIEAAFGFASPNGVMCHLKALVKKGLVEVGEKGESRRFRAVESYDPPCLDLCAIILNVAEYKGSASWRAEGGRIDNGDGVWYDLEDARAIAYYLDHGPKSN